MFSWYVDLITVGARFVSGGHGTVRGGCTREIGACKWLVASDTCRPGCRYMMSTYITLSSAASLAVLRNVDQYSAHKFPV